MRKAVKRLTVLAISIFFWAGATTVFAFSFEMPDMNGRVTLGAWLVNWEQISDNASRFGSEAIQVDYLIDNKIAASGSLEVKIGKLETKLDYAKVEDSGGKALSSLAAGLNYAMGNVAFYGKYTHGAFEGKIYGKTADDFGSGTFKTDLNISDLMIYFYKYYGIGIRHLSYEFPQDLYLVKKDDPGKILLKGLQEITYTGNFVQISIDNLRFFEREGWVYGARGGYGRMKPSGKFYDESNAALKEYNQGKKVISEGDAYFVELDLAYAWGGKWKEKYDWHLNVGYRYSETVATFDADAPYSLVTDFTTRFHGPFLGFSVAM